MTETVVKTQTFPYYGHLRLYDGFVLKYVYEEELLRLQNVVGLAVDIVDCVPYLSRSGLSFNGCLRYDANEDNLVAVRGLVRVSGEPYLVLKSVAKLTRDLDVMFRIVRDHVKFVKEEKRHNVLVVYDNNFVEVWLSKDWRRARLLTPVLIGKTEDGYEIYSLPGYTLPTEVPPSAELLTVDGKQYLAYKLAVHNNKFNARKWFNAWVSKADNGLMLFVKRF